MIRNVSRKVNWQANWHEYRGCCHWIEVEMPPWQKSEHPCITAEMKMRFLQHTHTHMPYAERKYLFHLLSQSSELHNFSWSLPTGEDRSSGTAQKEVSMIRSRRLHPMPSTNALIQSESILSNFLANFVPLNEKKDAYATAQRFYPSAHLLEALWLSNFSFYPTILALPAASTKAQLPHPTSVFSVSPQLGIILLSNFPFYPNDLRACKKKNACSCTRCP